MKIRGPKKQKIPSQCKRYTLIHVCFFTRKEIEALEEAHVLAEAQRLSQLVEQQANKLELDFQQEELQQLKSEAEHMKIKAEKVRFVIKFSCAMEKQDLGYLWLYSFFFYTVSASDANDTKEQNEVLKIPNMFKMGGGGFLPDGHIKDSNCRARVKGGGNL